MADDNTPDRLDALLAIVADPKAAKKLADQMAQLVAAKADLAKSVAEHISRDAELKGKQKRLEEIEGEQQRERDRQATAENSLTDRAKLIRAYEDELQAKIVAHGQEHGRRSAELNTREQVVTRRENHVGQAETAVAADRALLDKKLAKAREFVDAQ
jgi:hypothetical protein